MLEMGVKQMIVFLEQGDHPGQVVAFGIREFNSHADGFSWVDGVRPHHTTSDFGEQQNLGWNIKMQDDARADAQGVRGFYEQASRAGIERKAGVGNGGF